MNKWLLVFCVTLNFVACKTPNLEPAESEIEGRYVQICPATWIERKLWKSAFTSYVAHKLLDNYMDCSQKPIFLTKQEMVDLYPRIDVTTPFKDMLAKSELPPGKLEYVVHGRAAGGTLGTFAVLIIGGFYPEGDDGWVFEGQASFKDTWDFDPRPDGERDPKKKDEMRTRFANDYLSGKPFEISSDWVNIVQRKGDKYDYATIVGLSPSFDTEPSYTETARKIQWILDRLKKLKK